MAKLKSNSALKKLDLDDIILLDNVRFEYEEIEETARSIERDGLIQPVTINSKNELTAGYRRYKAHKLLVSEGKPFNQIECIVRSGDFNILNLTENIHRSDLKPIELEKGLKKLIDKGMSQTEIAQRLNKRLTWVSDCLAGGKVREVAEEAGVDTTGLSTTAMSQIRKVPEDKIPETVEKVKKKGGTVKAAKIISNEGCSLKMGDFLFDRLGEKVAIVDSITEEGEKVEYGVRWLI